jgi:hypothetical protein
MNKDYFKDGESAVDSIFAEWETQIEKSKDENLNRVFNELKDSFTKFQVELIESGYKGYFSND